jgi:hypothetical protein
MSCLMGRLKPAARWSSAGRFAFLARHELARGALDDFAKARTGHGVRRPSKQQISPRRRPISALELLSQQRSICGNGARAQFFWHSGDSCEFAETFQRAFKGMAFATSVAI